MSKYIHRSHYVSLCIPANYRRVVFIIEVENEIKEICLEIEKRYEIRFLEIGTDKNHVYLLVQTVPMYSPKKIIQMIKSITAREIFRRRPEVKEQLWGWEFWSDGYYAGTVGKHANEQVITNYVKVRAKNQNIKGYIKQNN